MQSLTEEQMFDMERLQKENAELKTTSVEYERQAMYWHNLAIKGEGANKSLKNELHGVLGSDPDQNQAVVEQVLRALGAHVDIHEALKSVRGAWGWINRKIVMLALAAIVIVVIALNPQPLADAVQSGEVWLLAVIGIVVAGAVIYYTMRRR